VLRSLTAYHHCPHPLESIFERKVQTCVLVVRVIYRYWSARTCWLLDEHLSALDPATAVRVLRLTADAAVELNTRSGDAVSDRTLLRNLDPLETQ